MTSLVVGASLIDALFKICASVPLSGPDFLTHKEQGFHHVGPPFSQLPGIHSSGPCCLISFRSARHCTSSSLGWVFSSQASELQPYSVTQGKEKERQGHMGRRGGSLKMRKECTGQLYNLSTATQLPRVSARIYPARSFRLHSQGFIHHVMMTHSIF